MGKIAYLSEYYIEDVHLFYVYLFILNRLYPFTPFVNIINEEAGN